MTQELVQYSRFITKDNITTVSRLSYLNGSAGAVGAIFNAAFFKHVYLLKLLNLLSQSNMATNRSVTHVQSRKPKFKTIRFMSTDIQMYSTGLERVS